VGVVAFRPYSTWAQDEGERSSSRSGRFNLGGEEPPPRYHLIRRLDAVSLAPAGNRAPILQHTPSSAHLDLVLTVHILVVLCRCAGAHACPGLRTSHYFLPERSAARYTTHALCWLQPRHKSIGFAL
jgi:hypothetical protein